MLSSASYHQNGETVEGFRCLASDAKLKIAYIMTSVASLSVKLALHVAANSQS